MKILQEEFTTGGIGKSTYFIKAFARIKHLETRLIIRSGRGNHQIRPRDRLDKVVPSYHKRLYYTKAFIGMLTCLSDPSAFIATTFKIVLLIKHRDFVLSPRAPSKLEVTDLLSCLQNCSEKVNQFILLVNTYRPVLISSSVRLFSIRANSC